MVKDAMGRVTRQLAKGDSARAWCYYYTPYHAVECSPLGSRTTYEYDGRKRTIAETKSFPDPAVPGSSPWSFRYKTAYSYDGQEHLSKVVDPAGLQTTYAYDGLNNLTQVTANDGTYVATTYYAGTNMPYQSWHSSDAGKKSTVVYNAQFQPTSVTDRLNRVTTSGYNATTGTPAWIKNPKDNAGDPDVQTTFGYDAHDSLNSITYPGRPAVTMGNDSLTDDVLWVQDANGKRINYTYNKRREPLTVTAPDSGVVTTTYDNNRNIATVTDPRGNRSLFGYPDITTGVATPWPIPTIRRAT